MTAAQMCDLWIETDDDGYVVNWHPDALRMIRRTGQWIKRQRLPFLFVVGRPRLVELELAIRGHVLVVEGMLRPGDARAISVTCRIEPVPSQPAGGSVLRWTFTRIGDVVAA